MSLIDAVLYRDGRPVTTSSDALATIARARADDAFAWVDIVAPDQAQLQALARTLGWHPLAVADAMRGHERSKIGNNGDGVMLVLHPARYDDAGESVSCSELDLFAGPGYLVSVRASAQIDLAETRRRLEAHPDLLAEGSAAVIAAIVDRVINQYLPVLDGVEHDIDQIEGQLASTAPTVARRIFALQREVIDLQHATSPLPDVLATLETWTAHARGHRDAPIVHDLVGHARHVVDRVLAFRHALESALQVNAIMVEQENNDRMRRMSETGLEQNEQVKKVSGWAAILFAPTLVGTIYGMNFQYMPELRWPLGYPMALLLMVATSVTLYLVFRRKRWL